MTENEERLLEPLKQRFFKHGVVLAQAWVATVMRGQHIVVVGRVLS
jgi:hypothetical protein